MQIPTEQELLDSIKPAQRDEPNSGIIVAVNHGMGRPDVIPLWTGEGQLPTPDFICEAAVKALRDGETFYTWQRGIPPLREALANYHTQQFSRPFSPENFFVTTGGMQAMQTIFQLLAGEGDEIILPTPAWPNYPGPLRMMGVLPVYAPMKFADGKWTLDLDRVFDSFTERTRAICLNSPSNPIGWVASLDEITAILEFARKHGIWVIADEVYSRFYYPESGDAKTLGLVPGYLRSGRAGYFRQHLLQELGHDRLANGLGTGAGRGRQCHRADHSVQHVRCRGIPAARRRRGNRAGRGFCRTAGRNGAAKPRHGLAKSCPVSAGPLRGAAWRLLSVLFAGRHARYDTNRVADHR